MRHPPRFLPNVARRRFALFVLSLALGALGGLPAFGQTATPTDTPTETPTSTPTPTATPTVACAAGQTPLSIPIAATNDDVTLWGYSPVYDAPVCQFIDFDNTDLFAADELLSGTYYRAVAAMRFDTSGIPGGTRVAQGDLRIAPNFKLMIFPDTTGALTGTYYDGSVSTYSCGDFAARPTGSPAFNVSFGVIPWGSTTLPLTSVTGINAAGYTAFRVWGIGTQPLADLDQTILGFSSVDDPTPTANAEGPVLELCVEPAPTPATDYVTQYLFAPTATPTFPPTWTPTATPTITPTPTITNTPGSTATPSNTYTPTQTWTPSSTATATPTRTITNTPTVTPFGFPTAPPTPGTDYFPQYLAGPTRTVTSTVTPSSTPTLTATPSLTPTGATPTATIPPVVRCTVDADCGGNGICLTPTPG
jgi:hypothetical protein